MENFVVFSIVLFGLTSLLGIVLMSGKSKESNQSVRNLSNEEIKEKISNLNRKANQFKAAGLKHH